MYALGDEDRPFNLFCSNDPGYLVHYADCTVREAINELFTIEVIAIAETEDPSIDAFIGHTMTVSAKMEAEIDKSARPTFFDGIVTEAVWEGSTEEGQRYRLTLEPWLAVADRRHNMRIFHDEAVTNILSKIFADYHGSGGTFRFDCTPSNEPIEYTVQYNESDLAFARRIMERYGLSFYFEHSLGRHTLVVFNDKSSLPRVPDDKINLYENTSVHIGEEQNLTRWMPRRRVVTGSQTLIDYDFKAPKRALMTERPGTREYPSGKLESYQYPGGYADTTKGRVEARRRLEGMESQDNRVTAAGLAYKLRAGMLFTLACPERSDAPLNDTEHMCVQAYHQLPSQSYASSSGGAGSNFEYRGTYEIAPFDEPFAPMEVTAKPVIHGPQTAIVDGGGTTHCDEYGRIKVRFHWDRYDSLSMWCRVSQSWAGPGWGTFFLPRKGMEVIVEFINGDPDHPIVTGCVYNGSNKPPYLLPDEAEKSTIRTQTVDGSGTNELRFDDKAGEEEIFLMAQKNLNVFVENNSTHHTLNDRIERTDNDRADGAKNLFHQVADKAMQISVGMGKVSNYLDADEDGAYGTSSVSIATVEGAGQGSGDFSLEAAGKLGQLIGRDFKETIGQSMESKIGVNKKTTIGGSYTVKASAPIEIESPAMITLKCGSSKIVMTPGSIQIETLALTAKGNAAAMFESGGVTNIKAGGLLALQGALLKLN